MGALHYSRWVPRLRPARHPAPAASAAPVPPTPTEAVENAVKIARNYTGRQNIIAFDVSWGSLAHCLMLAAPSTVFCYLPVAI